MIEEGEFKGKVGMFVFLRVIVGMVKYVGVVGVGKRGEATTSAMLTLGFVVVV